MSPAEFVTRVAYLGAGGAGSVPAFDSHDWPAVVGIAVQHRVGQLLHEALSSAPGGTVPEADMRALEEQVLRSTATRLLCESTLGDVLRTLRPKGIELIVLKGPSVAHDLYPRPELRLYHDLDVLCRPADYAGLREALLARGYTSAGTHERRGSHEQLAEKPSARESQQVRAFYDPSGEMKVEVHFDIFQLGLVDRHAEQLWAESRTRMAGDIEMRVLAPEHQFLQLAVHAHRHGYGRLSWLIELDLLVRRQKDPIDWKRTAVFAREEGVGPMLRHALATAHAVLGTPLPRLPAPTIEERCLGVFYRKLWPFGSTRGLNSREHHRLLHFLPDDPDPRNYLYGLVLVGRRREKLQALFRRLLTALSRGR